MAQTKNPRRVEATEARAKLVARAVAMAKLAPEDPYSGLAETHAHAGAPHRDLDLFDGSEPTPEELEDRARAAEDAARAMPRISNSEGGSALSLIHISEPTRPY